MSRYIKEHSKKKGLPPGALVHIGEKKQDKTKITLFNYSEKKFSEKEISDVNDCLKLSDTSSTSWINVDGLHETKKIKEICSCFNLHPLLVEDIVNTEHRPKIEDHEQYIFITLKMIYLDPETKKIDAEQVSIIFGKNFVLSFQEREGDVFEHVRERLRNDGKIIKKGGTDYLAYTLIDAIVDNYFAILESVGEHLEEIEERLLKNPTSAVMRNIHDLKREMIFLRKAVWPLRDVLSSTGRSESQLLKKNTKDYFRDVHDHTVQVIETIETFREMLSGIQDLYQSSVSNKMNEVMKVLTIIATIFIPLTFVTGLYGMNFKYMPEIAWEYGYPAALLLMVMMATVMILYFRKKKWM